jgi:hypothetical protein
MAAGATAGVNLVCAYSNIKKAAASRFFYTLNFDFHPLFADQNCFNACLFRGALISS